MQGDVLYILLGANGDCRFLRVPLDTSLLASISRAGPDGTFSLYRRPDWRITPVAKFVALFCMERKVSISAIGRQIGVAQSTLIRWRAERRRAASMPGEADVLALLRKLALRADDEA